MVVVRDGPCQSLCFSIVDLSRYFYGEDYGDLGMVIWGCGDDMRE